MKNILVRILVVMTIVISPLAFVHAGKAAAPGIQKKTPPIISNVSVIYGQNTATISWETSVPTTGSVMVNYALDGVGYIDEKFGLRHEVTVSYTAGSASYTIFSQSEKYGNAVPYSGTLGN